jgi:L-iditol 2-dehydrogenase
MHAFQLTRPRTFSLIHTPEPDLSREAPGSVLVRLRRAVICGSDLVEFSGKRRTLRYPLPAGMPVHECVGEVVESTSELFAPGDQVLAVPNEHRGLLECFQTHESACIRLPAELADLECSTLAQPLSTVLYAVDKLLQYPASGSRKGKGTEQAAPASQTRAGYTPFPNMSRDSAPGDIAGTSVAVVGLGPIGQLFCWLLKLRGAASIVGIDPCPSRCTFAEQMGASRTFAQRALEVVQAMHHDPTTWQAPDICIEAAGQQTETINDCIELVRHNGTILLFGVPVQPLYSIEYSLLFRKNLRLIASVTPEWRQYLSLASELVGQHHHELAPLITHRFPVAEAQQAYTLYEQQQDALKVLLDASQWDRQSS